jgi:hypothetical protein
VTTTLVGTPDPDEFDTSEARFDAMMCEAEPAQVVTYRYPACTTSAGIATTIVWNTASTS